MKKTFFATMLAALLILGVCYVSGSYLLSPSSSLLASVSSMQCIQANASLGNDGYCHCNSGYIKTDHSNALSTCEPNVKTCNDVVSQGEDLQKQIYQLQKEYTVSLWKLEQAKVDLKNAIAASEKATSTLR